MFYLGVHDKFTMGQGRRQAGLSGSESCVHLLLGLSRFTRYFQFDSMTLMNETIQGSGL
jgi:hypothetical protein